MEASYHRHDISDELWERLDPILLGRKGTWGGNARDNRQFINAVFWILRTGALMIFAVKSTAKTAHKNAIETLAFL
jgi:transposase